MKLSSFNYTVAKNTEKEYLYIIFNLLKTEKAQHKDDAVIMKHLSKTALVLTGVHSETGCQHW